MRFYPPDHPLAGEALSRLTAALGEILSDRRPLSLQVTESTLLFEGEEVYTSEDLREGIPFMLFRDGVRSLGFLPGLSREEILSFVEVLVRVREIDKSEHDVVTMLWERDFAHIEYLVVDPLLEGGTEADEEVDRLVAEVRQKVMRATSAGMTGSPTDGGSAALTKEEGEREPEVGEIIDQAELGRLEGALHQERDALEEFGVVLIEMVVHASGDDEVSHVARSLRELASSYLEWGEFERLTALVGHVLALKPALGARAALVQPVLDDVTGPEHLSKAVFALDGPHDGCREGTEGFLMAVRELVYPTLVDLLVEADGKQSRRCLLNVLMAGDGVPLRLIVPRLRDPRWYVVRNMVYLLGRLKDTSAIAHLENTLRHPDDRVRKEAIRSLAAVGGASTGDIVANALEDSSPSVRIVAARQLAASGATSALPGLHRRVGAKDFPGRTDDEIDAFLGAIGRLGDDRSIEVLDDLWAGRSLFRSKPLHVRLLALRAVGEIGTARAKETLTKAVRDGNEAVRQQAKRSLWQAERQTGA